MKWTPFADIDADIKLALQRRKLRISNRNLKEYSKTSFIKVWPVSIVELSKQDFPKLTTDSKPTQTDAAVDRYVLGMQAAGVKDPLSSYKNKYNRPAAGITGLSVQYEGFSGKGLVKMQLKGVINTLEDLDIYKPILFTPGKYWMLEWGYLPDPDKKLGDGIHNNLITPKTITDLYSAKDMAAIFAEVEKHRITTKGTAEIQVAVVNNYEYTLNAAGSFEFTVEFTGNSTLFRNNSSGAAGSGFRAEAATFTDAAGNALTKKEFDELANLATKPEADELDITKFSDLQTVATDNLNVALGVETMNLDIVEKFKASTPADFFKNLKSYIIECYKSSGKEINPNAFDAFNIDRLNPSFLPEEEAQGKSELNVKKHGIYYEAEKVPMIQAGQKFDYNSFNNELGPYVTWGWFEDNILNVVYSKNKDTSKPIKWESIDQDGVPLPLNSHKYLYTTTPNRLIIPGRMPEMLEKPWKDRTHMARSLGAVSVTNTQMVRGTGDYSEFTKDNPGLSSNMMINKIYGAYHPIVYDYISISQSALGFDEQILQQTNYSNNPAFEAMLHKKMMTDLYDQREALIETKPDERGSVRRLLLHYRLIQDSFINAATPIEGLKTLLHKIEGMGYKGFWEFDIFEVDNKMGVYEKNSLTGLSEQVLSKVRAQMKQNKIDSKKQNDTPPAGEAFVFPTWNKDGGFVLNQNLTVKMPSTTMLAMVYGNSLDGVRALQNKSFGDSDQAQLFSAISGGKQKPQKVSADPGFQGSMIDVVKSTDIEGNQVTTRIAQKFITLSTEATRLREKDEAVEFMFTGTERIKIDDSYEGKQANNSIFEKGASLDAHGMMYENVKQVMNHRLSKTWMKKGSEWIKISGRDTRVLDMAELSLKISGISGLNWGNQFHTDYIEERFKKEVIFFISKVNHEINEGNWTTEIVGKMRGVFNDEYVKEKVSLTKEEDRYISIQLTDADERLVNKMSKERAQILINNGRFTRVAKS